MFTLAEYGVKTTYLCEVNSEQRSVIYLAKCVQLTEQHKRSLYQKNVYEPWRKMKEEMNIYFNLNVISFVYFVFSAKLSLRYSLFFFKELN